MRVVPVLETDPGLEAFQTQRDHAAARIKLEIARAPFDREMPRCRTRKGEVPVRVEHKIRSERRRVAGQLGLDGQHARECNVVQRTRRRNAAMIEIEMFERERCGIDRELRLADRHLLVRHRDLHGRAQHNSRRALILELRNRARP